MPFIIDARNMGGGSIGSAAGGDTSTGTRNNVTLAAPWDENKEYLKGDLATNNGDLYQAQKSVPAGVQISDEDYWALVVAGDKSKETEQLRKDIGSLGDLETESKDNLVDAINEVNRIQPVITKLSADKMDKTNPTGTGSFSMNRKAGTVIGDYSHAEGSTTTASGFGSHAEGGSTTASKDYSHAEGMNTTASNHYSHAEGTSTTASGYSSHAEGSSTKASGSYSHAEGDSTTASGYSSHAEGLYTTASGDYSHAEGRRTKASGKYSHAQGKFNIEDTSNIYADIIGNGTSDTARSNATTVDWNGNAWFAGDVYTGSTSGTNKDEGSKKLATEEYVNNSIAAGGTDISLGLTSASVGQIIKVKAIDASGKPTAWEAADMPSGGEHWEKITEIELTDAASLITINKDATGKPFALKRVMIDCTINIDQDNAMTYVKTLLNNMTVCSNKSVNFAASATGYYSFYAELIPGSGALAWQTAATNNYNWGGEILKMGYKYNQIWQSNAITSLTISPNDGGKNFGIAGTKIAVQGVRA